MKIKLRAGETSIKQGANLRSKPQKQLAIANLGGNRFAYCRPADLGDPRVLQEIRKRERLTELDLSRLLNRRSPMWKKLMNNDDWQVALIGREDLSDPERRVIGSGKREITLRRGERDRRDGASQREKLQSRYLLVNMGENMVAFGRESDIDNPRAVEEISRRKDLQLFRPNHVVFEYARNEEWDGYENISQAPKGWLPYYTIDWEKRFFTKEELLVLVMHWHGIVNEKDARKEVYERHYGSLERSERIDASERFRQQILSRLKP